MRARTMPSAMASSRLGAPRVPSRRRGDPRRPAGRVSRLRCRASLPEPPGVQTAFRAPPTTCSGAASEARAVIRLLREAAAQNEPCPRRVRVELPLPLADLDSDALAFAGLHGQASDWSGGMSQRFRVTKGLIDAFVLDGYENEYLGLLDRDADGMGVWKIGGSMPSEKHDATLVTHPADTTAGFFLKLLDGDYGARVAEKEHLVIVVNAFWSGSGEKVGQPWELALRRRAREVLDVRAVLPSVGGLPSDEKAQKRTLKNWDKVYCARRCRSAAGVEGTLRRAWPGPWRLFDAEGVRVVLEAEDEPSNRAIAEALNADADVGDAAGYNRDAADTSRDDDVIT